MNYSPSRMDSCFSLLFKYVKQAEPPNVHCCKSLQCRCGPCKVMAPKFLRLSEEYLDVTFMKLNCNQENKACWCFSYEDSQLLPWSLLWSLQISLQHLAKELGIKVVPTFKILKDGKVVKEVRGAKFDDLVLAIETVKSSWHSSTWTNTSSLSNTMSMILQMKKLNYICWIWLSGVLHWL